MPNNQSYDPRISFPVNRLSKSISLIVDAISQATPIADGRVQLIDGTFTHGNRVRLSAASTGAFGSKDESPARLWEMGDEQIYAGIEDSYFSTKPDGFEVETYGDDPNSPWEKPSFLGPKIDRTTQRHPYEDWTYRLNDDAGTFLGWHKALGGQETTIQKDALYVSFYRKDSSPFMAFRYRDIGNVTGAGFEFAADQWGVGEPIEVLYSGQTYPGYVVRQLDDNSIEYITTRNILISGRQTATITGLNSGTTFTITSASTTYPAPSSIKIMRVWDASDDTAPQRNRWLSWTSDMVGLGGALNYDDSGSLEVNKWVHYELYIRLLDRVNQIVEIETRIDGVVKHKYEASYDNGTSTFDFTGGYAPNIALLGQDPNRDVNSKSWISNIYADWTAKRIVIGDAPNYEDCTFREMQRIETWNPDYVDVFLNFGALPSGKNLYVFVFDDRNNLIETVNLNYSTTGTTLAPVASGVSLSGSRVTVSGYNFGSKSQAAPILYDHTDSVWQNGVEETRQSTFTDGQPILKVEDDPNTLWEKPAGLTTDSTQMSVVRSRTLRHPDATAHYHGSGTDSYLGWPKASGGVANPSNSNRSYAACWVKLPFNMSRYYAIPADANTVNFITNGQYEYGEEITISGITERGKIIHYYPTLGTLTHGWLFIEVPDGVLNSNSLVGQTITGVTSGTTITFPTEPSLSKFDDNGFLIPRGKYMRLWSDAAGDQWRFSIGNVGVASTPGTLWTNQFGSKYPIPRQWNLFEVILDKGPDTPYFQVLLNGEVYVEGDQQFYDAITNSEITDPNFASISLLGLNDFMLLPFEIEISDIYLDNTYQRVYLGDAPTWDAVTHKELQMPVSWDDDQIVFDIFNGALNIGENRWVYVVGKNGKVNQNGVQI